MRTIRRGVIGGSGLQEPKILEAPIEAGKVYWLGASSSPSLILVTAVDKERGRICYCRTFSAEWEEKPVISFCQQWIMADLIATAERTIRKQARNMRAHKEEAAWWEGVAEWQEAYIGGKPYEFNHRYVCNCCGSDFDELDSKGDSPCCGQDWREPKSAMRMIGVNHN